MSEYITKLIATNTHTKLCFFKMKAAAPRCVDVTEADVMAVTINLKIILEFCSNF